MDAIIDVSIVCPYCKSEDLQGVSIFMPGHEETRFMQCVDDSCGKWFAIRTKTEVKCRIYTLDQKETISLT